MPSSGYHLMVGETGAGNMKHTPRNSNLADNFLIVIEVHALSFLCPPCEAFGYTHATFSAMTCRGMNELSHATSAMER